MAYAIKEVENYHMVKRGCHSFLALDTASSGEDVSVDPTDAHT
jgi:hypothetical protein